MYISTTEKNVLPLLALISSLSVELPVQALQEELVHEGDEAGVVWTEEANREFLFLVETPAERCRAVSEER